jgi:hypothetical protein
MKALFAIKLFRDMINGTPHVFTTTNFKAPYMWNWHVQYTKLIKKNKKFIIWLGGKGAWKVPLSSLPQAAALLLTTVPGIPLARHTYCTWRQKTELLTRAHHLICRHLLTQVKIKPLPCKLLYLRHISSRKVDAIA